MPKTLLINNLEKDAFTEEYNSQSLMYRFQNRIFKSRLEEMQKRIKPKDSSFLIDVGCGPMFACKTLPLHTDYIGVDVISSNRLHKYRDNMRLVLKKESIEGIRASGCYLPFKSNIADLISALDVLEHLIYPVSCTTEINRVSLQGGLIIISLPLEGALQKLLRIGFVFGKLTGKDETLKDNQMLMVLGWMFKNPWYHYVGNLKGYRAMRKMLLGTFILEEEIFTPFKWGKFNINSVMFFHKG